MSYQVNLHKNVNLLYLTSLLLCLKQHGFLAHLLPGTAFTLLTKMSTLKRAHFCICALTRNRTWIAGTANLHSIH